MKKFYQFRITFRPIDIETVSGLLWQLDLDGINETDDGLLVFVDESKNIIRDDIEKILTQMIVDNMINEFTIEEESVEDKNWNEEYEKKVRVIEVSEKLVIKPSFKDYAPKPDQIIITIDPKMSFGTGEHATTKMVLKLVEKYVKPDMKVLDVGSGTGVLGIAAVMLGAKSALGIDNDEWCLLNGNENVKANGLEEKVEIRHAEIAQIEETRFDLITANINKHILLEISAIVKSKLSQQGILILSGLLQIDKEEVLNEYTSLNLKILESTQEDEWCALVLIN